MKIPKIIHFIWAGGTKFPHPKNINVIIQWLANNPDFKCYLWVDNQSYVDEWLWSEGLTPENNDYDQTKKEIQEELANFYQKKFKKFSRIYQTNHLWQQATRRK